MTAVAKNTVIEAGLLKKFENLDDSFLAPIQSKNELVNNDVINFNDIGADPDVLIDNITYPIAVAGRTDQGYPVSLHKLETTNQKITDDELFALTYDKVSSVRERHAKSLMRSYLKLGAWSLAPQTTAAATPVIQTTGATVGLRKRLTPDDLVTFKGICDNFEIDLENRFLILCNDHANDLLLVDQSFRDRFNSTQTGKVMQQLYGFNIFVSPHTPKYVGTTYAKKAFGATAAASDISASVFYTDTNAFKALGSTSAYYRAAAQDPENRQSVFGARQYGIVSPVVPRGYAAITDAYTGS